jgi:hypothetical protein
MASGREGMRTFGSCPMSESPPTQLWPPASTLYRDILRTASGVFHHQFTSNGYNFPGEAKALNAGFSVPHDSAHVITGYDTTPRGEILVSVFTSTMHKHLPMGAHVLPVIFIWHLRIQINSVAGKAQTPMDPENFWCAWAAGAGSRADTFAPGWDFWALAERSLAEVEQSSAYPPRASKRGQTLTTPDPRRGDAGAAHGPTRTFVAGGSDLQHEMSAPLRPAHLLVIDHPLCDERIDRTFRQTLTPICLLTLTFLSTADGGPW